jgi:ribosomal protein S1
MEVVKLHQAVRVKVISVDAERKRVAFSIKQAD